MNYEFRSMINHVKNWIAANCRFASSIAPPPAMLRVILKAIKDYRSNPKIYGKEQGIKIPVDLTDWKYGNENLIELWKENKFKSSLEMNEKLSEISKNGN